MYIIIKGLLIFPKFDLLNSRYGLSAGVNGKKKMGKKMGPEKQVQIIEVWIIEVRLYIEIHHLFQYLLHYMHMFCILLFTYNKGFVKFNLWPCDILTS